MKPRKNFYVNFVNIRYYYFFLQIVIRYANVLSYLLSKKKFERFFEKSIWGFKN